MLSILITAVGLSMDALSLSIAYGTLNMKRSQIWCLSSIVGLFHFFMPILGNWLGSNIISFFNIDPNIVAGIILGVIAVQMILSIFKEENINILVSLASLLLFGFSVSIDSFSVGIGIKALSNNLILCALIFSVVSSFFTFLGLNIGKFLNDKIGKYAMILGGLLLISMSIYCLFTM